MQRPGDLAGYRASLSRVALGSSQSESRPPRLYSPTPSHSRPGKGEAPRGPKSDTNQNFKQNVDLEMQDDM